MVALCYERDKTKQILCKVPLVRSCSIQNNNLPFISNNPLANIDPGSEIKHLAMSLTLGNGFNVFFFHVGLAPYQITFPNKEKRSLYNNYKEYQQGRIVYLDEKAEI